MFSKVLLILAFVGLNFRGSDAVACGGITSETTCLNTAGCVWASSACACGSDIQMDIVFALDASGSIGSSDYQIELDWTAGVITSGLTDDSRVSFIQFATNSYTKLNLNNGYTTSQLTNFVYSNNLAYTGGWTNTVQALKDTMTQFDTYSGSGISKVLILITDGNPYLGNGGDTDVCAQAPYLFARGITTVIIGVGSGLNWNNVDCLVSDPANMIAVSSYSQAALNSIILPTLTTVTCPVTFTLTITEAQVEQYGTPSQGSRFVEVYNSGGTIDLQFLELSGLFTGVASTTSTNVAQGQYIVFYDGDVDDPDCQDCDCTLNGNNWCTSQATYIECCSSGCPCAFGGNSMANNDNFYQMLTDASDTSGTTIVDSITYASGTWPTVRDGYTYELQEKGYDNDIGANWDESCNVRGTPGADPITNCSFTCTDTQCQLNGGNGCCGSGTTCNNDINKCICNDYNYYTTDTACKLVPNPSNCIVYLNKQTQIGDEIYEISSLEFVWTAAQMTIPHQYEIAYYGIDGSNATGYTASRTLTTTEFDEDRDMDKTWGRVRTYVTWNGNNAFSDWAICDLVTQSPTAAPTDSPSGVPIPAPTEMPTTKPTYESPYCYVGGDICENDRCECYNKDESCTGNALERSFAASDDPQFLTIKCFPRDFGFAINVFWSMSFLGYTDENGVLLNSSNSTNSSSASADERRRLTFTETLSRILLQDDDDTDDDDDDDDDEYVDRGVNPPDGNVTFPVDDSNNEQRISLMMSVDTKVSSSARYRKFLLSVDSCEIVGTDEYACRPLYPTELNMVVDISGGSAYNQNKRQKEMPEWVWYLLACLAIFLVVLAWLVYRYWFKSKEATQQLGETENELERAMEDNELGLDHDLGMGDIAMNPMATGVPNTERAPDKIQFEMDRRKLEANRTKVDAPTEKFNERQEIGQLQGNKRNGGNDLSQPLLGN